MTDYIVVASGADGADGSSATPWASPVFAMKNMQAGDTLKLLGSSKQNPFRISRLALANTDSKDMLFDLATRYFGDGMQYIWMGENLTHGDASPQVFPIPEMDKFLSDGSLWEGVFSGDDPTKETTVTDGAASTKFLRTVSAGSTLTVTDMAVTSELPIVITIRYVNADAASDLQYRLRNRTDSTEWDDDGTPPAWVGGSATNHITPHYVASPGPGDFGEVVITADAISGTPDKKKLELIIASATLNQPIYVDSITIRQGDGTNNWSLVQSDPVNGNVYEINTIEPTMVWTCTKAEWTESGIDALSDLGDPNLMALHGGLSTYADVLTTPNSWAFDAQVLRVNIGAETIDNLHIEASFDESRARVRASAAAVISNMHFAGGRNSTYFNTTVYGKHLRVSHGWATCQFTGTNNSIVEDIEIFKAMKDGCTVGNSGGTVAVTLKQVYGHHCKDECTQAIFGASMTIRGGYYEDNGSLIHGGGGAIGAEGAGSTFDVAGVTVTRSYGNGIDAHVADASGCSVKDSITYGNNVGNTGGGTDLACALDASGIGTLERVHYGTELQSGITDGVDGCVHLTESPWITAPVLKETATAVGAAVKWWNGGELPIGYDGEPFSLNTDIGGNQSTFSPFHPVNL